MLGYVQSTHFKGPDVGRGRKAPEGPASLLLAVQPPQDCSRKPLALRASVLILPLVAQRLDALTLPGGPGSRARGWGQF